MGTPPRAGVAHRCRDHVLVSRRFQQFALARCGEQFDEQRWVHDLAFLLLPLNLSAGSVVNDERMIRPHAATTRWPHMAHTDHCCTRVMWLVDYRHRMEEDAAGRCRRSRSRIRRLAR